jgi:hypothetical protein
MILASPHPYEFGPRLSVIRPMLSRPAECHHLHQCGLPVAMTLVRFRRQPTAASNWRVVQIDTVDKIERSFNG